MFQCKCVIITCEDGEYGGVCCLGPPSWNELEFWWKRVSSWAWAWLWPSTEQFRSSQSWIKGTLYYCNQCLFFAKNNCLFTLWQLVTHDRDLLKKELGRVQQHLPSTSISSLYKFPSGKQLQVISSPSLIDIEYWSFSRNFTSCFPQSVFIIYSGLWCTPKAVWISHEWTSVTEKDTWSLWESHAGVRIFQRAASFCSVQTGLDHSRIADIESKVWWYYGWEAAPWARSSQSKSNEGGGSERDQWFAQAAARSRFQRKWHQWNPQSTIC